MAKKQFKAESKRLLDLMINSIYTHQEIFLREIISNASDAIDKLAYLALTDEKVGLNRSDFAILLKPDADARTLTVSDNGIGMDRDEMENNLGTICRSGSLQFKKDMEKAEDIDIIGQFGVGFYSAFMVAENVTVISRKYGSDEAWKWTSSGADGYTIEPAQRDAAGTDVIMTLKADTDDEQYSRFIKTWELQQLVKKYSDYIRYPIKMEVEKSRVKEETKDSDKPEYESYREVETLNSMVPIWQKNKKDVTEEEYNNFYKEKFYDYEDPVAVIHASVEGAVTYKALLYIPAKAPYDFYTKEFKKGLQLYSSGVMIMEHCEDLLPDCFRFVRGVVDSQDLSLNISREMLQQDRQLKIIARALEKKIKKELEEMLTNDREAYEKFWKSFGLQLKYALYSSFGGERDLLENLLLFTRASDSKLCTLKEYRDAMPEAQKYIYYAAGESAEKLAHLPQAETVLDKGYDLLCLTDDVDEFLMQILHAYDEKEFRSISGGDLGLETEEEKKEIEEKAEQNKDLFACMGEALDGKVSAVVLSAKLKSHPVCLSSKGAVSIEMEKVLDSMPNAENAPKAEKVLEINGEHPVFAALTKAFAAGDTDKVKQYADLLYNQARLIEGLSVEDPVAFSNAVCALMQ